MSIANFHEDLQEIVTEIVFDTPGANLVNCSNSTTFATRPGYYMTRDGDLVIMLKPSFLVYVKDAISPIDYSKKNKPQHLIHAVITAPDCTIIFDEF